FGDWVIGGLGDYASSPQSPNLKSPSPQIQPILTVSFRALQSACFVLVHSYFFHCSMETLLARRWKIVLAGLAQALGSSAQSGLPPEPGATRQTFTRPRKEGAQS